jgi:hypothetical protein
LSVKECKECCRNQEQEQVKMGIQVPWNTKEALFFDRINKNTLWANSIFKEMCGLSTFECVQVPFAKPQVRQKRWMAIRTLCI